MGKREMQAEIKQIKDKFNDLVDGHICHKALEAKIIAMDHHIKCLDAKLHLLEQTQMSTCDTCEEQFKLSELKEATVERDGKKFKGMVCDDCWDILKEELDGDEDDGLEINGNPITSVDDTKPTAEEYEEYVKKCLREYGATHTKGGPLCRPSYSIFADSPYAVYELGALIHFGL